MINPMSKRSTLVALIVIALFSITIFTQFGGRTSSPVEPSTTSSTATSSSFNTSSTQQKSTSTSSSSERIIMAFSQVYNSLFVTPSVTLNYTITISQFEATGSHVTVSAASTVPGVTLTVSPNEFTFLRTQEAVDIGISVAPTVNSSILPVEITASTATGATSSTFDFTLNKALVVLLPSLGLTPSTLHASVGQTVTWLNLMASENQGDGLATVALVDGSVASPSIGVNDAWSHTFDKPGTYSYQVTVTSYGTLSGTVNIA
jgi:plastocyanin